LCSSTTYDPVELLLRVFYQRTKSDIYCIFQETFTPAAGARARSEENAVVHAMVNRTSSFPLRIKHRRPLRIKHRRKGQKPSKRPTDSVPKASSVFSYRYWFMISSSGLRQRNPQQPPPLPLPLPPGEEEEEQPRPEPPSNRVSNGDMPYGRRNFIAYQRTGNTPNAALPISTRSLGSYRNKILLILVVTSLYTAFLYQRGQYS
jgi:hypothetical protein